MIHRETPKFTGVIIYRDPQGRFSVRYPSDWATFEIAEGVPPAPKSTSKRKAVRAAKRGRPAAATPAVAATEENPLPVREGFGFTPDGSDPQTAFTVWVSPLGDSVIAEDLDVLKAGVDDGLAELEDCTVLEATDSTLSNLIKFERIYTFRQDGILRKRKQWLMYVDTWLMCLTWQGSNLEEYEYWFNMVNHSFLTFEIPQALWFATDRDLSAVRPNTSTPSE